jgi:transcriptional regulator with XRE-family HTH domain
MNLKQKQKIGQTLKDIRIERKISLRKMAVLYGIKDKNGITQIENGLFGGEETPKRYCAALGLKFYGNYSFKIVG